MAFSARGRSNARPSAASRFTLLRPTCMPVTTRLRPSAGPTRQRSCKCCWAPCPSTAPRSTSTPPRHAQCATTGLRPKRAPKPRPPARPMKRTRPPMRPKQNAAANRRHRAGCGLRRCAELCRNYPGHGSNARPAQYGPGRHGLCQRPGGGRPASTRDRAVVGHWTDPAASAL